MSTLVTFLMPAFNAMPLLRETIRSMQSQTLRDFAAIIVDDGSTDGTGDYLDSLGDSRFRIVHQENTGYVEALNRGADLVQTKYFARIDADDLALPQRLEKQVAFLEQHHDVAIVASRIGYIFGQNRRFRMKIGPWQKSPSFAPPMVDRPFWNPSTDGETVTHSSVTLRTDAFLSVEKYRDLAPAEDTDLWLRLHDAGYKLACLDEILALYRVGAGSVSSQAYSRQMQILRYARHSHALRCQKQPDISFQDYAAAHPLKPEEEASVLARLRLRNAMGELLSGRFVKGSFSLAKVIASDPTGFLNKLRSRC